MDIGNCSAEGTVPVGRSTAAGQRDMAISVLLCGLFF